MLISKGALGVTTQMHSSSRALSTLSSSNYFSKTRSTHPNKISQARNIVGLVDAIDKRVYRWAKGVMPPISQTEQIALGSGTIGFDRDIFTGSPSLQHLVDTYEPKLSPEEEVFINEKVAFL